MTTATRKRTTRKTSKGRTPAETAALIKAFNAQVDAFMAELDEDELEVISTLHPQYSERNSIAIFMQRPDATQVKTFMAWQSDAHRRVRTGEGVKGVTIIRFKGEYKNMETNAETGEETVSSVLRRFGLMSVFDVTDTRDMTETELAELKAKQAEKETE